MGKTNGITGKNCKVSQFQNENRRNRKKSTKAPTKKVSLQPETTSVSLPIIIFYRNNCRFKKSLEKLLLVFWVVKM